MKIQKYLSSLNFIFGAALALTPFFIFPVCAEVKPETHMGCYYSGIFILIFSLIIFLTGKTGKFNSLAAIASSIAAILCYFVPNGIIKFQIDGKICSLCADPSHACRALTMPAVNILIALIIISCIAILILNFVAAAPLSKGGR